MSFLDFVKRLFFRPVGPARAPLTPPVAAAPCPQPPQPVAAAPPSIGAMLRTEEMLDQQGRLAGYRFSLKTGQGQAPPPGAYLDALRAARVSSLAERRLAVMAIGLDEWLAEDFASLNARHTVWQIDMPDASEALSPEWLAGLQRIRASGAGIALSCQPTVPGLDAALAMATHGFLDFTHAGIEGFERQVKRLRQAFPALILAAENVATWSERRLCIDRGTGLVMGSFLSTVDENDQNGKLSESRLVLIEMLNLVREDGDAQAIAEVAKRDPGVTVQILSRANSAAYGLGQPLTGIDQAIMVLGRETLYRQLAMSIFRAGEDSARNATLLEVALARARFLELAALSVSSKQQADELFLVGLLSFVDTLLGMPMKDIVATMSLPQIVQDVLLRSDGPYGRYLLLTLSVEKCLPERATKLAYTLGIELDDLSQYRNAALQWAEEAVG